MELSKLQQKIIDAPFNKTIVIASAASGKTRCMTEKVRKLLREGVNPKKIAVITFTNMAAGELKTRLGDDYKDGLFVGTIHALANYMLCTSGIDTSDIISQERFDELFDMVKENPQCIKRYDWILLDEAQDSDPPQFEFLFSMIDPPNFFLVGDPKQCIYQFKGSDSSLVENLGLEDNIHVVSLNENYRNGQNILSYAKRIIYPTGLRDDSVSVHYGDGTVTETIIDFRKLPQQVSSYDEFKDWAILCRTNSEVAQVCFVLGRAKIPFESFKQGDLTNDELLKKMQTNTVKVLTIHSSKGLEWNNVIVIGARFSPIEERNVSYVAATRAKERLIWGLSNYRGRQYGQLKRW